MESGSELLSPQDTSKVMISGKIPAAKKHRIFWCTEDNWTRLKKDLVNSRYPAAKGQCDESCL